MAEMGDDNEGLLKLHSVRRLVKREPENRKTIDEVNE